MTLQRPTVDDILIRSAFLWAERSTCSRAKNGAVLSRDGRILSTGYNGVPAGLPHCEHKCSCAGYPHADYCESKSPCLQTIHAEMNAIAFAARNGISTNNATLFCTMMPCVDCCKLIINAGIGCISYVNEYRDMNGIELLCKSGVYVTKMEKP